MNFNRDPRPTRTGKPLEVAMHAGLAAVYSQWNLSAAGGAQLPLLFAPCVERLDMLLTMVPRGERHEYRSEVAQAFGSWLGICCLKHGAAPSLPRSYAMLQELAGPFGEHIYPEVCTFTVGVKISIPHPYPKDDRQRLVAHLLANRAKPTGVTLTGARYFWVMERAYLDDPRDVFAAIECTSTSEAAADDLAVALLRDLAALEWPFPVGIATAEVRFSAVLYSGAVGRPCGVTAGAFGSLAPALPCSVPVAAPGRWFALTDNEALVPVGRHTTWEQAQDCAPGNTLWLFDVERLRLLQERIADTLAGVEGDDKSVPSGTITAFMLRPELNAGTGLLPPSRR